MSTEIDFKSLWNKEGTSDIPDTKELIEKAGDLKRITRSKLIRLNLLLLATAVFMIYIGFNIDNEKLTTKIGIALITVAIVSYLAAYNQLMPLLFKSDMEMSSHEYLNQLIRIKRKQDFLNKVMINVYFSLFSVGMFLYLLQFAMRGTLIGNVLVYGLTFGWIGFSWFYLRPRGIKKKQQPLMEMINKLKAVDEQLKGE
jgi:hypothetical protein